MAEFQEVMRQFDRMCNAHAGCIDCPLHRSCGTRDECDLWTFTGKPDYIENKVLEWAAKHPEPVYPTWYAWLTGMGVVPVELPPYQAAMVTDIGLLKKIPADIAQKLGIEPVPVVHSDCGATNEADARKKLGLESKEDTKNG